MIKALDTAAEMSGWGTPLPEGTARAIALEERGAEAGHHATVSAQVHTVSIGKQGEVRLMRVDVVHDEGFGLVNPLPPSTCANALYPTRGQRGEPCYWFGGCLGELTGYGDTILRLPRRRGSTRSKITFAGTLYKLDPRLKMPSPKPKTVGISYTFPHEFRALIK